MSARVVHPARLSDVNAHVIVSDTGLLGLYLTQCAVYNPVSVRRYS